MNDDPTQVNNLTVKIVEIANIQDSVLFTQLKPNIVLSEPGFYGLSGLYSQPNALRGSAIANLNNALAGKPLVYETITEVASKKPPEFIYSKAAQEGYKQGIQVAVAWLLAYDKTIPLARLQPSLSFITNKMEEELSVPKQICQECDPPGCGQECRGRPCGKCHGLGVV